MIKIIAPKILRFLINNLIVNSFTYLPGMFFIRVSRKMRAAYASSTTVEDMQIVNNCMGKIIMRLDKNSYMGGSIYWSGFHHVNEMLFLRSYLTKDMVFIDIGANQGEFSLFAASILTMGKVISFEPVTKQHQYLVTNIRLNSFQNIELNKYGLSNEEIILPIFTSKNTELHSGVHEGLSTLYKSDERNVFEENVDIKIFDKEYAGRITRMDFIKIDIEGAELYALKGMKDHLEKFKPTILIEISDVTFNSAGYSTKEMTDFLYSFGYNSYKIHRGKLIQHNKVFSEWGNYIFKLKE